jgi:hypothetical protein
VTGRVQADPDRGERRSGLRPIGEAAASVAAPIVAHGGGGVFARLKAEWRAIVGDELAARSWPEKLGRDGALRLLVVPGFALDLQHRAPLVMERINLFFGRASVARLVLMQGCLPLTDQSAADAGLRRPAAPPSPDDRGMLDLRLSGVDDPELRAALAGLGELVLRAGRHSG